MVSYNIYLCLPGRPPRPLGSSLDLLCHPTSVCALLTSVYSWSCFCSHVPMQAVRDAGFHRYPIRAGAAGRSLGRWWCSALVGMGAQEVQLRPGKPQQPGKTLMVGCGPGPGACLAGRGLEKGGILAFIWFLLAWNLFFHLLTFKLYVSIDLKWASCRQHIHRSYFFIHSTTLSLLVGVFWIRTPKIMINMYVLMAIWWIVLEMFL